MNRDERIKMIKAMNHVARKVKDASVFDLWFNVGVADWDVEHDDLEKYYYDDTDFADLMDIFLALMHNAYQNGGLRCDGVLSKPITVDYDVSDVDFHKEDFIALLDSMIKIDKLCSKKCVCQPTYNLMLHDRFEGSIGALERVKKLLTDPEYYEDMKKLYC